MLYAIVINGVVADLVSPPDGGTIDQLSFLTPQQKSSTIEVPAGVLVAKNWTYANGVFTPPGGTPQLSISQQALVALTSGLLITSGGTSALNGTYPVDMMAQLKIIGVVTYITNNNNFPGKTSTFSWPDVSSTFHTFPSVTAFKNFATVVADYVAALDEIIVSGSGLLPSSSATIP